MAAGVGDYVYGDVQKGLMIRKSLSMTIVLERMSIRREGLWIM